MTLKQRFIKIHFYLLIFVLTNFILSQLFGIGIHGNIIFALKVIIFLTGLTSFFMTIRPFKKLSLYFSLYLLSPVIIFLSWLADGIFGALLGSIFLAMFYPPDIKLRDGEYIFQEKFQGFLGSCCTYDVLQNRFLVLQKKVGEIRITEEHSLKNSKFKVVNKTGYLKVDLAVYNGLDNLDRKVDTTLTINLE